MNSSRSLARESSLAIVDRRDEIARTNLKFCLLTFCANLFFSQSREQRLLRWEQLLPVGRWCGSREQLPLVSVLFTSKTRTILLWGLVACLTPLVEITYQVPLSRYRAFENVIQAKLDIQLGK